MKRKTGKIIFLIDPVAGREEFYFNGQTVRNFSKRILAQFFDSLSG
jgi:hypothetical protein